MNTNQTPKKRPVRDWSRIRIKRALEDKGWSMRGLAKANGRYPTSVSRVIADRWIDMELIVAKALGVPAHKIWPSRWLTEDGRILCVTERKSTKVRQPSNTKDRQATK